MKKRLPAMLASLVLAALPIAAVAAAPPCLTPSEFTALSNYALPSVINGTTERCATVLPAGAWLKRNGAQLAERYAAGKAAAWPAAKTAFLKLASSGGGNDATGLMKTLPDNSQQQIADAFIAGLVGQRLPAERCSVIDRLISLVAPLPRENTAELIAVMAGLAAKTGRARVGIISICQA